MTQEVSAFYDLQAKLSQSLHSISRRGLPFHRALYPNGDENKQQALQVSYDLVLEQIEAYQSENKAKNPSLLIGDFGAGCGEALRLLAARLPAAQFIGIVNSAVQHRIAEDALMTQEFWHLRQRTQMICGDFTQISWPLPFDIIFSIESFIHSPDPSSFLSNAALHLKPGGRLILIDDFIARRPVNPRLKAKLACYKKQLLAQSLISIEEVRNEAQKVGLELTTVRDLTPYIRLQRNMDGARNIFMPWLRIFASRNPLVGRLIGKDALDTLLTEGVIHYRLLTLKRV